jgi:hypothetical protein
LGKVPKLPPMKARDIEAILARAGFVLDRQTDLAFGVGATVSSLFPRIRATSRSVH